MIATVSGDASFRGIAIAIGAGRHSPTAALVSMAAFLAEPARGLRSQEDLLSRVLSEERVVLARRRVGLLR